MPAFSGVHGIGSSQPQRSGGYTGGFRFPGLEGRGDDGKGYKVAAEIRLLFPLFRDLLHSVVMWFIIVYHTFQNG